MKKRYSERLSEVVAFALAEELRLRGLHGTAPEPRGPGGGSGAERRMAGGIGAKKVDVTWATAESGLLFAISVKSINWRDARSGNYQKNLVNRRGDMLIEAVTLHRRFPYAVLAGFIFLDHEAASDDTARRRSTFANAHHRLKLFTGRPDPAGRDEQYERMYLFLLAGDPDQPAFSVYEVGSPDEPVPLGDALDDLLRLVADRNPDFYEFEDGRLIKAR
ncbi:MAG TPA: hypothetical protein VHG91_18730 [Longimicrobium sp.]|nr:hypothetical protein [Longimicrobium sp.]